MTNVFQMMLAAFLAIWLTPAAAYEDLEFLYPDGKFSTPTTANMTTHKITHNYDEDMFKQHLNLLEDIRITINNSEIFKQTDQQDNPMFAIATNIFTTIDMIKRDMGELKGNFNKKTIGEPSATDNTTINIDTQKWFQNIHLAQSTSLKNLLGTIGHIALPINLTVSTRNTAIQQATILQNTLSLYYKDFNNYQNFVSNIRNIQLNNKDITTLVDHLQPLHKNEHIAHVEITYMSASTAHIDFEVTITTLSDIKQYITYTNIPYAGYQIKGNFYSYSSVSHYFQLKCVNGYCLEQPTDPCTTALHRGTHLEILNNCELERNENPFKTTKSGIFIFTKPIHDIKQLLDDHDLTVESWPAFVTFQGCYSLPHLNMKFNGCINERKSVHTSQIDPNLITDFVDTTFAEKVGEYVTNIPMLIALIFIPASTIASVCIMKSTYNKCCKPQPPKPKRIPLLPVQKSGKTRTTARNHLINLD